MSLARVASRIVRQELRAHIAWLPLANNFAVGDFGVFSGGVFTRLGNVAALGAKFGTRVADGSPFEFRSSGTTEVRVAGGVAVSKFEPDDEDVSLKIGFASADSLYLRATSLKIHEMDELLPVALALRRHPQWRMRYRVVHRMWVAEHGIFITSRSAEAQIEFSGQVNAINALAAGRADLDVQIASRRDVGLDLVGHTGPLALGLFRVRVIDGSPDLVDFGTDPDLLELDESADDPEDDV